MLCLIYKISIVYISGKKYTEFLFAEDDKITGIIEQKSDLSVKNTVDLEYISTVRKSYWFIENIQKPLSAPSAYTIKELQDISTKFTTTSIAFIIRTFGDDLPLFKKKYFTASKETIKEYNAKTGKTENWDDPKAEGYKDNFNYEPLICTAPAKKIDGIFTNIKGFNNKTKVYDKINETLFLSDHFPLELKLDINPKPANSVITESTTSSLTSGITQPIVTDAATPPTPKPVTLANPPKLGSRRGFPSNPSVSQGNPQAQITPGWRGFPKWPRRRITKSGEFGTAIGGTIKKNKINVIHSKMYNKYKTTQKK